MLQFVVALGALERARIDRVAEIPDAFFQRVVDDEHTIEPPFRFPHLGESPELRSKNGNSDVNLCLDESFYTGLSSLAVTVTTATRQWRQRGVPRGKPHV